MEKLKLSQVVPDKNQPRKYFAAEKLAVLRESVKKHGIVNPIIVEKTKDGYLIVDGERRFRVAKDLKLSEVPVVVIKSKNPIDRLVEQFHIQETHEGWTPMEKAQTIVRLSEESKMSLKTVCDMLNLPEGTARRYMLFATLGKVSQEKMIELQVPTEHIDGITRIKNHVKHIREGVLGEAFTLSEARNVEKQCIEMIKHKEIVTRSDYSKLKDSFTMNPKLIDKFLGGAQSISEMFVKSNAKSAYHARNMTHSAYYAYQHGSAFLKNPNVKLSQRDVHSLELCAKVVKQVLSKAGVY